MRLFIALLLATLVSTLTFAEPYPLDYLGATICHQ